MYMYVHKLFKLMLLPEIRNDENAVEESLNEFKENIFMNEISDPDDILANLNDERLKKILRISRDQFIELLNVIKEFNKPHSRKQ